jgi:hypothetical protein
MYSHATDAINQAGITPIFVFQSEAAVIRRNQGEFPWSRTLTFVGDPEKVIYHTTGTEVSLWKAFLSAHYLFRKEFVRVLLCERAYVCSC